MPGTLSKGGPGARCPHPVNRACCCIKCVQERLLSCPIDAWSHQRSRTQRPWSDRQLPHVFSVHQFLSLRGRSGAGRAASVSGVKAIYLSRLARWALHVCIGWTPSGRVGKDGRVRCRSLDLRACRGAGDGWQPPGGATWRAGRRRGRGGGPRTDSGALKCAIRARATDARPTDEPPALMGELGASRGVGPAPPARGPGGRAGGPIAEESLSDGWSEIGPAFRPRSGRRPRGAESSPAPRLRGLRASGTVSSDSARCRLAADRRPARSRSPRARRSACPGARP